MKQGLTASLLVCLAAAGVAVGALALQPGDDQPSQATGTTPVDASTPSPADPYGSSTDSGDGAARATDAVLVISDFEFSALTVAAGATVTVQNQDDFPHTANDDEGAISSGAIDGGATGSFDAPTTAGTYELHCNFHPQMTGTLTVR